MRVPAATAAAAPSLWVLVAPEDCGGLSIQLWPALAEHGGRGGARARAALAGFERGECVAVAAAVAGEGGAASAPVRHAVRWLGQPLGPQQSLDAVAGADVVLRLDVRGATVRVARGRLRALSVFL